MYGSRPTWVYQKRETGKMTGTPQNKLRGDVGEETDRIGEFRDC